MPEPRFTEMWTDYHMAEIDRIVRRACTIVVVGAPILFIAVKGMGL